MCSAAGRRVGVEHDGDPFDAWRDLREQLQQLASNFPRALNSENSKANRIETSERPGGISRICSMEVVKNSEENSENERCYANTSYDPAQVCC